MIIIIKINKANHNKDYEPCGGIDKMKKYNFDIQDMLSIALVLVVTGLAIAFGLNVMGDVQGDMTANSVEANATQKAIEGVAKLPDKFPLIATVVVAAIIIGILVRYLFVRLR
jgi:hypothetical protein